MALMEAIVGFAHLIAGFDNKTVTGLMTTLLDQPYTARQATYDLRRLRRKGLIERLPHSHRYQLTPADVASRCCSPRPTDGSSPRDWPPSTPRSPTTWPNAVRSPSPAAT